MRNKQQQGIALVITLIMLSVVTFMTVVFLAVSRREQASVSVTQDQADSKFMAEAALERAKAEVISRIMARSNAFAYDLMVSTNYINPKGFYFATSGGSLELVSYVNARNSPLSPRELTNMLANLYYDPRVPVFVATNNAGAKEFRYYLDLNRNGVAETNGYLPVLNNDLTLVASNRIAQSNFFVGDPEWIGVLEYPDRPHGPTNRFIGRYAYLVLPTGKSLDLNYIHNRAKYPNDAGFVADGFRRNQGVGSWEINLAGFLRELNTNAWRSLPNSYNYSTNVGTPNGGTAFDDALAILKYRYSSNVALRADAVIPKAATVFKTDGIDAYAAGTIVNSNAAPRFADLDDPTRPWAGSDNRAGFYDIQELYSRPAVSNLATRLQISQATTGPLFNTNGSYGRYTFYRMLAQMGTESVPANVGKIHLNYDNLTAGSSAVALASLVTNYVEWTPLRFFTNTADALLRADLNLPLTNVQVWPLTNSAIEFASDGTFKQFLPYDARIHRALQLAANIYDASHTTTGTVDYPSVFRPLFQKGVEGTNVVLAGYTTNGTALSDINAASWKDLNDPSARASLQLNDYVYGIPWVVGVKKGFPNFNKLSIGTAATITRKLDITKLVSGGYHTNQMYLLGITNVVGVDAWNSYSYTNAYPRTVSLTINSLFSVALTNGGVVPVMLFNTNTSITKLIGTYAANTWRSNQFQTLVTNRYLLPTSVYQFTKSPAFVDARIASGFETTTGFPVPNWGLVATNRMIYVISEGNQVVDFVNLSDLKNSWNFWNETQQLKNARGNSSGLSQMWSTNRADSKQPFNVNAPTVGITNQIGVSLGMLPESQWISYSPSGVDGGDKATSIEYFRIFMGVSGNSPLLAAFNRRKDLQVHQQAPYSPTITLNFYSVWSANDPLVHYTVGDLTDLSRTNRVEVAPGVANFDPGILAIGQVNERYDPWGGRTGSQTDGTEMNYAYKDPLIRRSDNWSFPLHKFATIGELGLVHRGTPWQTVYLKSFPANEAPATWMRWSGHVGTHPTNDWRFLQLFTTALNDNAARGLLAVNQTNQAAWSAVLSGVSVLTNTVNGNVGQTAAASNLVVQIEPASLQMQRIVESINAAHSLSFSNITGTSFPYLGAVLSAPGLTVDSPYLNVTGRLRQNSISDAMYERIPMQILSLLKEDEPRVAIYAFGQSLKPAENSQLVSGVMHGMVTNYQVTGEYAVKALIRFDNAPKQPKAVVENFSLLPAD